MGTSDHNWRAGTASAVITPEKSVWMGGYAARDNPAEGVERDLQATGLALEDAEGNRVAFVGVDVQCIPESVRNAVVRRCKDRHGLLGEALVLNASHTHCGPEVSANEAGFRRMEGGHGEDVTAYHQRLEEELIDAVGDALQNLSPAHLSFARARAAFGINRRTPTDDGYINNPYPDGPVDTDVPVLRVDDPDGDLRAVMFGYACHANTLDFYQFCPDWPGYARQYIEDAHPGATAVFLTGCAADQNPYPRRDISFARDHGRTLANAVETALQARAEPLAGPIGATYDTVEIAFDDPPSRNQLRKRRKSDDGWIARHAEYLLEQIEREGELSETYDYPVQTITLGGLTLVTLAGEPVVEYALRLKEELDDAVWVAGYSNAACGYIPSEIVCREGGYEGDWWVKFSVAPAPYSPGTEDRIISAVHRQVDAAKDDS